MVFDCGVQTAMPLVIWSCVVLIDHHCFRADTPQHTADVLAIFACYEINVAVENESLTQHASASVTKRPIFQSLFMQPTAVKTPEVYYLECIG